MPSPDPEPRLAHGRSEAVVEIPMAPVALRASQMVQWQNRVVAVAAVVGVPIALRVLAIVRVEGESETWIAVMDWTIWAIFAVDLAFELHEEGWRSRFWRRHWVGVAIVALTSPFTPLRLHGMSLLRLARADRLMRVLATTSEAARGLGATVGRWGLAYVAMVTVLVIASGAGGIGIVEPDLAHGRYWDGVWWAIVTTKTVDYGDIAPGTVTGLLIATALMLTVIGLASTLSGSVGAYVVPGQRAQDLQQVADRLDRIERLRADIQRDLAAPSEASRSDLATITRAVEAAHRVTATRPTPGDDPGSDA